MAHRPKNPLIPTRQGVSPSCVAIPHTRPAPWPSVLQFLSERLPVVSPAAWAQRLVQGDVLDDHGQPVAPDAPCEPGARLYYWRHLDDEADIPFEPEVLYQDDLLLVADKPHFMPVTPTGRFVRHSLMVRLKHLTGIDTLNPIHRIDRETAGIVAFSLRPQDRNAYHALFRDRAVGKLYEAIAPHDPALAFPQTRRSRIEEDVEAFFRMVEVEGEDHAANSETRIERVEVRGAWARYRLWPVTGKRHQLRVHMNALGLPLAGDRFYPRVQRGPDAEEDFAEPLRLLAHTLSFDDPVTGHPRLFQSRRSLDWPGN
ncbi:MAG: pseudouridine synthase [Hydrogenophaga sp.]|nr:pseudouridine synthase [Hydrogenophaga sp.]